MKSLICSIILLCSIICSTILVGIYTDRQLTAFIDTVDRKINTEYEIASTEDVEELEGEFKKIKPYLILFMKKDELRDIEMHISDIESAVKSKDIPSVTSAKSRLILHLAQLRRLSTFSIEAIF